MAYCTLADVESLTGIKFAETSRPTASDVEEFIDDAAADLDGVAQAAGYTVPVTGAAAAALMKKYNKFSASAQAWHAGYLTDTLPPRVEYWQAEYAAFIGRLRRGEQQLPAEAADEGVDAPAFAISADWVTHTELDD